MLCEDVPIHVIVPHRIIAVGALHLLMVVFLGPKEMKKNLGQIGSDWVRLWVRLGQTLGQISPKKLRLEHPTFPSIQKTWFTYSESSDSGYSEYVLLVLVACVVKEKSSRP